jgi:hypothetical protein
MTGRWIAAVGCLGLGVIGACYPYPQAAQSQSAVPTPRSPASAPQTRPVGAVSPTLLTPRDTPRAVIDKYCVTCHNETLKTAGLMLDGMDVLHVGEAVEKNSCNPPDHCNSTLDTTEEVCGGRRTPGKLG